MNLGSNLPSNSPALIRNSKWSWIFCFFIFSSLFKKPIVKYSFATALMVISMYDFSIKRSSAFTFSLKISEYSSINLLKSSSINFDI